MTAIIGNRPGNGISYDLLYWSDISVSNNGKENRTTKTGENFDVIVNHHYRMDQFDGLEERNRLRHSVHGEYKVPFFIEESFIFRDNPHNQDSSSVILGDTTAVNAINAVGDEVFVNGELRTIMQIEDTFISFDEAIDLRNKVTFNIIPSITIQRIEPASTEFIPNHHQRNIITISGKSKEYNKPFVDTIGISVFDRLPIFNTIPYVENLQEFVYDQRGKLLDDDEGGNFEVVVKQDRANIKGFFTFYANTYEDWQRYKGWLNYFQGRHNTFLMPWRTNDLEFLQYGGDRSIIIVKDDGDIGLNLVPNQRLEIRMPSGIVFYVQTQDIAHIVTNNQVEALLIELDQTIIGNEFPVSISYMDVCRLGSDIITINYDAGIHYIGMNIESIIEDEPLVDIVNDSEFTTGFSLDFRA